MTAQMAKVRSDDTRALKANALGYVPLNQAVPFMANAAGKSARGYNHKTTGRLLCPRSMRDDYDFDKETCAPGAIDPK